MCDCCEQLSHDWEILQPSQKAITGYLQGKGDHGGTYRVLVVFGAFRASHVGFGAPSSWALSSSFRTDMMRNKHEKAETWACSYLGR